MTEQMKEIKGYFKIEKFDAEGNLLTTYEDYNKIMTRIPELYAGLCSGFFKRDADTYAIHAVALGTGGTTYDSLGKEIPKEISPAREQIFSEESFWNDLGDQTNGRPVIDEHKIVYQRTWENVPYGDQGSNVSGGTTNSGGTEGCTYPLDILYNLNTPATCNGTEYSLIPNAYRTSYSGDDLLNAFSVQSYLEGSVITYQIELGQFAGNNVDGSNRLYTEAGLYMEYLANIDPKTTSVCTGDPLGQLFSMKTFPPQFKNNTCALKITWKLYF